MREKLAGMNIVASDAHILTAGQAAVASIAQRLPGGHVYVVGEAPLIELVQSYGLKAVSGDDTAAEAVIVGLDRSFDYAKLAAASSIVRAGALFVTINRDPVLPIAGGFIPGCGSLTAAIERASGVTPEIVGKPEPMLLRQAMRQLDSTPDETVMIGDSLEIDILAGLRAGTHTLLVLSGASSLVDVEKSTTKPELIYDDLAAVVADLG